MGISRRVNAGTHHLATACHIQVNGKSQIRSVLLCEVCLGVTAVVTHSDSGPRLVPSSVLCRLCRHSTHQESENVP